MRRFFLFSFLLLLWLLAGCQSSRPEFYFGYRPAPEQPTLVRPDSLDLASSATCHLPATLSAIRPRSRPVTLRPDFYPFPARRPASGWSSSAATSRPVRVTQLVRQQVVQQKHPRTAAHFAHGKGPGKTMRAVLFVAGLVVLLIAFVIVQIIHKGKARRSAARQVYRPFYTRRHRAATHPTDALHGLGVLLFFLCVGLLALLVLLLWLTLGAAVAIIVGATGIGLLLTIADDLLG